jgi:uncharacterized membrane protein YfcA
MAVAVPSPSERAEGFASAGAVAETVTATAAVPKAARDIPTEPGEFYSHTADPSKVLAPEFLVVLVCTGIVGGAVAGIGGPGGPPVLIVLNLALALSPTAAAATASGIFIVATAAATVLYHHSDGIDWRLAAVVGGPALAGTLLGARVASSLPVELFEGILGGALVFAAGGIVYTQGDPDRLAGDWTARRVRTAVAAGSLVVGIVAGITGIGGPALTVPLMILLGIAPVTAIGAGVASGVLITTSTTLGHVVQGNSPALVPLVVVGGPYVAAQVLGWKYVHAVSGRAVSYTIAAVAVAGSVAIVVL